jgi:hypothetical protein
MSRVTQHYGIKGPVPFLNVDVNTDNELFLDPNAIRIGKGTYAKRSHAQLLDFFGEILTCARSTSPAALAKGERLLQSMHEPNETRLGYSQGGAHGHAFADEMGSRLWEEIRANRTLKSGTGANYSIQTAVMSRLERVPLFIKRIDRDMISDLATRVVFNVLADFTADMMIQYPSLANGATTKSHKVWDSSASDLMDADLTLPTVSGKQLLLVPKEWVYWRLVMDPDAFYNRYATQVIQDEQTTYTSNGKANKPTKDSIKKQNRDLKGTNVRQAVKYAEQHDRDLAGEYELELDQTFQPMSDEETESRLHD